MWGESSFDAQDALCGDCENRCDGVDECDAYQELMENYRERRDTFIEIMGILGVNNGDRVIPKIKELMGV